MNAAMIWVALLAVAGQQAADVGHDGRSAKERSQRLLKLHQDDAGSFAIYRDAARGQKLELRREPIFRWTNPARAGGQAGEVFIWTYRGRPEVIASIISHPSTDGRRMVWHELHSLSPEVLTVDRDGPERWVPRAPGVAWKPVEGAPAPGRAAAQRLAQMRSLSREFSGRSLSDQNRAWELRLLPQPLYRYEGTDPDVLDGAVFALVSTAGTDPEIILLLEAREAPQGPLWYYAAARFSDMSLWLKHKGREVWTSIRSAENTFNHGAEDRYRLYRDRIIPEIADDAPGPRPH